MRSPLDDVLSHWHEPIGSFQIPVQDFYSRVTERVIDHAMPDARFSRVEFSEAGALSARREYLRVERLGFRFDVCAAPFGSNSFVSWWLTKTPVPWWAMVMWSAIAVILWSVLFLILAFAFWSAIGLFGAAMQPTPEPMGPFGRQASMSGAAILLAFLQLVSMFVAYGVSVIIFFVGLHVAARRGLVDEEIVLALPIIGWVYRHIFSPTTFYRLDTAEAFRDAVHSIVNETLKEMTPAGGTRPAPDMGPKPIMTGLLVAS